jgi:hypothetical protein
MKYLIVLILLISCNALEVLTDKRTSIDPGFDPSRDSNNNGGYNTILSNIQWQQGVAHNTHTPTLQWQNNGHPDMNSLSYNVYRSSNCSGGATQAFVPISITAPNALPSITADGLLTLELVALDDSGLEIFRQCSPAITLDTNSPNQPTSLSWSQGTDTNSNSIEANWSISDPSDVTSLELIIYQDATCSTVLSNQSNLPSSQNSEVLSGVTENNYTFTVKSFDQAGNSSISSCSSVLAVDLTPPSQATALIWIGTNPVTLASSVTLSVNWMPSTDTDVSSQEVEFFTDPNCTAAIIGSSIQLGNTIGSHNYPVSNTGDYYFRVKTIDEALNETLSLCSPTAMVVQ